MCTQNELIKILEVFVGSVKKEIGNKLSDVILFGSYARGDYDEESDVDVAVIVDVPQGEEHIYYKQLTKIIGDIDELKTANNRAYYCVFHAMRAVIALDEQDFKKLSGVISYFREHYRFCV